MGECLVSHGVRCGASMEYFCHWHAQLRGPSGVCQTLLLPRHSLRGPEQINLSLKVTLPGDTTTSGPARLTSKAEETAHRRTCNP